MHVTIGYWILRVLRLLNGLSSTHDRCEAKSSEVHGLCQERITHTCHFCWSGNCEAHSHTVVLNGRQVTVCPECYTKGEWDEEITI